MTLRQQPLESGREEGGAMAEGRDHGRAKIRSCSSPKKRGWLRGGAGWKLRHGNDF